MHDYEYAVTQHRIGCRLAKRVMFPDTVPAERLRRFGVGPEKLFPYPGLKEEYYLYDFEPDPDSLKRLSVDTERVVGGTTWEEFCDRLKAAGQIILRPETPASELDRSEGWRYLARLTRIALEMALEHTDPDFPQFLHAPHATAKVGAIVGVVTRTTMSVGVAATAGSSGRSRRPR